MTPLDADAAEAQRRLRRQRRSLRLHAIERAIGNAMAEAMRSVAAIAGAGLVSYGAWLAWVPGGYAVAGAFLIAFVWLRDRASGD